MDGLDCTILNLYPFKIVIKLYQTLPGIIKIPYQSNRTSDLFNGKNVADLLVTSQLHDSFGACILFHLFILKRNHVIEIRLKNQEGRK